ncbi:reverse transcriptase domain-containing protein [Tanacetum coccineum]|uniref:Reverse transcriptase domain-containing protein n=1 Tax=Tanacetum coccineum TaxID=301880 RepID=A0ABQ4YV62_9ASTR
MSTLAEFKILYGGDNCSPMLEKHLYDSWKSIMELYMQNREHGRMILESVEHGPLIWPTIEENGVTMTKKYEELSAIEKIQVDCDLKATDIILQCLPSYVYSLVNHHKVAKNLWERVQLLMQVNQQTHLAEFPQIDSGLAVPVFKQGDDPIDAINKMMSFLSTVVTSRFPTTNNQLRNSSNPRQQATIHDGRVTVQPVQGRQSSFAAGTSGTRANISGIGGNNSGQQRVVKCFNCQGEGHMARQYPKPKRKRDATCSYGQFVYGSDVYGSDDFSNCNKCLELEAELKDEYNRLLKSFSKLEQHCISLELAMQLNNKFFQKNDTSVNQTAPIFDHLFKLNNLKAELQAKDTTIKILKANIKRLNKTSTINSVKRDIDEIETINIEP